MLSGNKPESFNSFDPRSAFTPHSVNSSIHATTPAVANSTSLMMPITKPQDFQSFGSIQHGMSFPNTSQLPTYDNTDRDFKPVFVPTTAFQSAYQPTPSFQSGYQPSTVLQSGSQLTMFNSTQHFQTFGGPQLKMFGSNTQDSLPVLANTQSRLPNYDNSKLAWAPNNPTTTTVKSAPNNWNSFQLPN